MSIGPRSLLSPPPRWLRNSGVESPQQRKGDSSWKCARSTDWATRSLSCRPTSTPRPLVSSSSSASSTSGMAGIPDSARARPGSPGAWGSRRARPGSTSGWRARSARCRCCRTRSPAASCPTPRSGLTRVATPETEERLLAVGRAGTAAHVERIVRGWRRMDRKAEAREADRQHAGRALHVYPDEDGSVRIRGRLAPEVGALLMQALAAAREALYQQQADALALLAESALHHGIDPGAPGERYQVVVHVDAAVLADPDQAGQSVLEDGLRVPAGTSQRLACDASRVVMRHDAAGRR